MSKPQIEGIMFGSLLALGKEQDKLNMKIVPKGWGYEKWIVNKEAYCGKLLHFYKGKQCSWHFHKIKDEVFYILSGKLRVHFAEHDDLENAYTMDLGPGERFHVPVGLRHRMYAIEETEMFEFSTTHFDSDSIRIEKGD